MVNRKCIICDVEKERSISIGESNICLECEEKIINSDLTKEEYELYLNKIKNNILSQDIMKEVLTDEKREIYRI